MKKLTTIILSAFLILSAFTGCQELEEGADFDSNTHDDTISNCDPMPYIAYDMETFLNDLKYAQASTSNNENLYIPNSASTSTLSIKIPVLQNDKYDIYTVEVNKHGYVYSYAPIDKKVDGAFQYADIYKDIIYVGMSKKDGSFNGVEYDAISNSWTIDNDGKWMYVMFPKYIVLKDVNAISDYFTFENYVISTNNSTETE